MVVGAKGSRGSPLVISGAAPLKAMTSEMVVEEAALVVLMGAAACTSVLMNDPLLAAAVNCG